MAKNLEQRMLTSTELAGLFGLSIMSIGRLTDDGILVPIKGQRARKFPMEDSIKHYVKYLRDKLANRNDTKEALNEALCHKTELQNRKLEAELSLIEGRTHSTEDVRRVMNDMLGSFRVRLWAFPNTASDRLVNIPDREAISDVLREEIAALCTLLADYSPEQFYARNSDYLEEDENDETPEAAEPEGKL